MKVSTFRLSRVVVAKAFVALLLASVCLAQTPAPSGDNAPSTLDAALAQAATLHTPLVLLVAESGQSHADDAARSLLESSAVKARTDSLTIFVLDLGASRNRAIAARFHPIETPLLLCLSPNGVIISRDQTRLSKKLVQKRMDEALKKAPGLDANLAALEAGLRTNSNTLTAQLELASFLLDCGNAREAIPHFAVIAHAETTADDLRTSAWVALARAHLWIGEPEKAREEAQELVLSLGTRRPNARAGAELVLGIHDANLNRPAQARQEFEDAITAAPESSYAKEAARLLEELRRGWKVK